MKKSQRIDDLNEMFRNISLPSINVKQDVMKRIMEKKEGKNDMFNKKRLLIAAVLAVILLFTVAFTALKVWELNGPGNSSFKYHLIDQNNSDPKINELIKPEFEKAKPGEALAIMKVNNNPNHNISILLTKPLVMNRVDELRIKVGRNLLLPSRLPEGYTFKEGQLNAGLTKTVRAEMIKEAQKADKLAVIKILNPEYCLQFCTVVYKNDDKEIDISQNYIWGGKEFGEPDKGQNVTKVKVNDFEAIYTDGKGRAEVKWIDSTNGLEKLISVGCPEGSVTKEDLIKVAESLK